MDVSVVFVVTRKKASRVETLTGSLRDSDDQQWEALYLRNGELYLSQTCGTRALAEAHLASSAPRSRPSVGHGRPLRTRRRGGTRVGRRNPLLARWIATGRTSLLEMPLEMPTTRGAA